MALSRIASVALLTVWSGCLSAWSPLQANEVDILIGSDPSFRLRVSLSSEDAGWIDRFDKLQDRYHDLLFDRLDADGDGRLTKAEAQRMPAPRFRLDSSRVGKSSETHIAFNFLVVDDDGDKLISRRELKLYYAEYETHAIGFGRLPAPDLSETGAQGLFQRLDLNRDAHLSTDEIQAASKLWQFDRNSDGLLSLLEIQPSATASNTGEFVAAPAYPLKSRTNVSVQSLRTPADSPPANRELKYRFLKEQFGLLPLKDGKRGEGTATRVVMKHADLQIEFGVRPNSLRTLQQIREVLRREVGSLAGEKKITDDDAFPVYLRNHAALMDANADGKLSETELDSYVSELLPVRIAAESARVMFRTSAPMTGLFAFLDSDSNGLLSKPELSRLSKVFAALDANRDQKLSLAELPLIVRILLEQETPPPPYLEADQPNAGPPWFYRMDQNLDGLLTPSEFPGRRELFDQIDRDHDQSISLAEALIADRKGQEN